MFRRFLHTLQEIPVTTALVLIHTVLFLIVWAAGGGVVFGTTEGGLFSVLWGMMPMDPDVLRQHGSLSAVLVWEGETHRLLFSALLHGNLVHLVMNNLNLYFLGEITERMMGSALFGLMYLVTLIAGSLASIIWIHPMIESVGASGAVMGIVGTLMVLLFLDRRGRFLEVRSHGRTIFVGLVLFTFVMGHYLTVVNNAAHIGGFVAGLAFGVFFWSRIPGESVPRVVGMAILTLLVVGLFMMGNYGLRREGNRAWTLAQGVRAFQEGKANQAERQLKASLSAFPKIATRYLGELFTQTEQWAEAEAIYAKRVEAEPGNFHLWFQWLTALAKRNKSKELDRALIEAKRRFATPKRRSAWLSLFGESSRSSQLSEQQELNLAMLYTASQRSQEALRIYRRLLREFPQSSRLRNDIAWLLVTAKDPKSRNPALARSHARMALRATSRPSAALLDTMAETLYASKMYKQAIQTNERAQGTPDGKELMLHLMRQQRKYKKAMQSQAKAKPKARGRRHSTPTQTRRVAPQR